AAEIQRLDADPVPRQQQPAAASVPKGKGKHAAQALDKLFPFVFVKMGDYLGIALCAKAMAFALQVGAETLVVVNLAVEDNLNGPVFVADRLVAAGKIDYGEPAVGEADAGTGPEALSVGAAVGDRARHAFQRSEVDRSHRLMK